MPYLSFKTSGTDKVLKDFKDFGREGVKQFEKITKLKAIEISEVAKQTARNKKIFDNGNLVQGIKPFQLNSKTWEVVASEPYSAYHEFGTGTTVSIPQGWERLAEQFKGDGIKQINLPARPYLYPSFMSVGKTYEKALDKKLKELGKKYSS